MQNGQKTTFEWPKCIPEVIFPRFWGGICIEKCFWIFDSGTRSTIFGTPEKLKPTKKCVGFSFSRVPKMVLTVPESKIRKHFSIQIPPQNLGKMTSGMHFDHSKVVFRPFYAFCTFYTNLRSRNDKMVLFQVKFHPAKRNVIKNIRPPMESS